MATLQSSTDLKDYCFRALGSPVINIEMDSAQAFDRIDDAIAFFVERHFNGTEEVYFKYTVSRADVDNGYISMPKEYVALLDVLSSSNPKTGEPQWSFQYRFMQDLNDRMIGGANSGTLSEYYISMSHLNLMQDLLTTKRSFLYNSISNHLYPKWKLTDVGSVNILKSPENITTTDWVSSNITATANDALDTSSQLNADTITTNAPGTFSLSQTIDTKSYVRGTYTVAFGIKAGTYTGNLTLSIHDSMGTLVKSQVITPSELWTKDFIQFTYDLHHADDIVVTLSGTSTAPGETLFIFNPWLYVNNILVLHGYKAIDTTQSVNVFNDRWVKKYATALIKQQWGSNLKKFEGVQMPGGITLNGQTIYDEATTEIDKLLEDFSMDYELSPVGGWY